MSCSVANNRNRNRIPYIGDGNKTAIEFWSSAATEGDDKGWCSATKTATVLRSFVDPQLNIDTDLIGISNLEFRQFDLRLSQGIFAWNRKLLKRRRSVRFGDINIQSRNLRCIKSLLAMALRVFVSYIASGLRKIDAKACVSWNNEGIICCDGQLCDDWLGETTFFYPLFINSRCDHWTGRFILNKNSSLRAWFI